MQVNMKWIIGFQKYVALYLKKHLHPSFTPVKVYSKQYSSYLGNWELPQGYRTGINIYNSAINKKVPLILQNKDIATWYVCGPTVYDESHIGHASCYVKFDIIRRIMENIFGIHVLFLMGITDIDDKIIQKSAEVGVNFLEISRKYEVEFFEDLSAMRVKPPTTIAHVTDNISYIISFCEKLIEKEYAYVTAEGNVYFAVSKGVSSDILSGLPEDSQLTIDPLKRDNRDFALWKAAKDDEPYWISPWGKGRPGWHIECSAIASKMFGSHLDLHSGGYDLLFPHHSNEKSQSEAYHGCSQWVNYWLHSGLLQIGNGIKMSKSIKNTISIKAFLKENCANDFRILCLQSAYRKNLIFSDETRTGAKALHKKFHNFINESESYISGEVSPPSIHNEKLLIKLESTKDQVNTLLADDFNTSQALFSLTSLIDEVNENLQLSTTLSHSVANNLMVIAACSDYVDKILFTLGVNIICKKKLRKEFVFFMDAVNQFRSQMKLFAVGQNKLNESRTPLEYINDLYLLYNKRKSLIDKFQDSYQIVSHIDKAVNFTYKQAMEFDEILHHTNESRHSADEKKTKYPNNVKLLHLCDGLRTILHDCGIALKDKREISTWFPLVTFPSK